ncbi:hypothetical protein EVAR_93955_1 [Eumeta japonica]|uniref:Uncharacterized protein n=1 Tax=Eumeta variegata TaxID=151549 RepID=A0A4C1TP68_EUMVA|nr:hypothetical protein EVAR_93955_1 [Eumeta japonica]
MLRQKSRNPHASRYAGGGAAADGAAGGRGAGAGGRLVVSFPFKYSGGARRWRRRRPPTASRLKGPRKQKSFAYKLLKRGLANPMSPTSTSGVAPPL